MSDKAPAPAKVNLTNTRIREFNPSKESWLRDDQSKLTVWCRPPGAKWYIFASHVNGQAVRIRLGKVADVNLHDARLKAQQYQRWIAEGKDPREVIAEQAKDEADAKEKQAADKAAADKAAADAEEAARREAEIRQRYTLQRLCDAYVAHLEAQGKVRYRDVRSAFRCHVTEAHPELAAKPAREITSDDVYDMVSKVRGAGKSHMAGQLRAHLSAAFNCAKRARYDSALPADLKHFCVESNPVDAIPAIRVSAGQRTLTAAELRTYIGTLGDSLADQALLLAVLAGGQRMEQLLRASVSDFDPETAVLRLWDGKGRRTSPREHLIPLAPRAAALVTLLVERARGAESTLLFSTHGAVQMSAFTPGKRVAEISAGMAGERFDLRDIRRTIETQLAALGISRDTRAQLLSHGLSGVQERHYDRHTYLNEKRHALVAWEHALEQGERASNVVTLRGAAVA